jgi:hypothetical protein
MANQGESPIPADLLADMQAVADAVAAGRPVDPEVARRVQERSKRLTEELRQNYGVLNVAVDLIREIRDEE